MNSPLTTIQTNGALQWHVCHAARCALIFRPTSNPRIPSIYPSKLRANFHLQVNFSVSVDAGLIWFWYIQYQALGIDLTSIWKEVGHLMHAKQSNESNSAIELSIWIEEDVKKSLLFNRIYFGQQMLNTCKKRCFRAFSMDKRGCKKASFSTEYI